MAIAGLLGGGLYVFNSFLNERYIGFTDMINSIESQTIESLTVTSLFLVGVDR